MIEGATIYEELSHDEQNLIMILDNNLLSAMREKIMKLWV